MQFYGIDCKISDFFPFYFDEYCTKTVKDLVNISVLKKNGFSSSKTIKITDDVILVRLFGKRLMLLHLDLKEKIMIRLIFHLM